jgi:hypothetical protein
MLEVLLPLPPVPTPCRDVAAVCRVGRSVFHAGGAVLLRSRVIRQARICRRSLLLSFRSYLACAAAAAAAAAAGEDCQPACV